MAMLSWYSAGTASNARRGALGRRGRTRARPAIRSPRPHRSDHRAIGPAGSSQSSASKLGRSDDEVAAITDDFPRRLVLAGGHGVGDGAANVVDLGDVAAKGVTGFAADAVGSHPAGQITDPGQVPVADLAERASLDQAVLGELAQCLELPIAGAQLASPSARPSSGRRAGRRCRGRRTRRRRSRRPARRGRCRRRTPPSGRTRRARRRRAGRTTRRRRRATCDAARTLGRPLRSSRNRSWRRRSISARVIDRHRAAPNSIASGMPSRREQVRPARARWASPTSRSGRAATARTRNSSNASSSGSDDTAMRCSPAHAERFAAGDQEAHVRTRPTNDTHEVSGASPGRARSCPTRPARRDRPTRRRSTRPRSGPATARRRARRARPGPRRRGWWRRPDHTTRPRRRSDAPRRRPPRGPGGSCPCRPHRRSTPRGGVAAPSHTDSNSSPRPTIASSVVGSAPGGPPVDTVWSPSRPTATR